MTPEEKELIDSIRQQVRVISEVAVANKERAERYLTALKLQACEFADLEEAEGSGAGTHYQVGGIRFHVTYDEAAEEYVAHEETTCERDT